MTVPCSFEFFPPKDEEGERKLWAAISRLEPLKPNFVSVTYGAGGSTRDRTLRITAQISTETTLTPVAHLTCVGHTRDELRAIAARYLESGVRHVLALRGDPPGRGEWVSTPSGIDTACDLVRLVKQVGDFEVGVAAFPEGRPGVWDIEAEADLLVKKEEAGASFAVTQMFFRAADYFTLVGHVRSRGSELMIIPGVMPITNALQITKFAELSGCSIPDDVARRIADCTTEEEVRREGVQIAHDLCRRLIDGGVPSLHFYTLNQSKATTEIYRRLVEA